MRILLAFIITVIIYILLIALYLLYFQNIKFSSSKKKFEHIIKIDIRDIPRYVEKSALKTPKQESKKEIAKKIKKEIKKASKKSVKKKIISKEVTPKKVIKKKVIVKKEVKKKAVPKKIEPKNPNPIFIEQEEEYRPEIIEVEEERILFEEEPIEEEVVKKEIVEEEIIYEYFPQESIEEQENMEEIVIQEPIIDEPIAEDEMLYIPNPIISENESRSEPKRRDNSLSSLLGQGSTPSSNTPKSPLIQKLYGASFDSFSLTQKRFIIDKLDSIHRITQSTLTRRGYPAGAVAMQTRQEGENIVSFDLHPNGDISNLRLEQEIGYRALDENTLQTIRIAYKDYPYPKETTHIVFYVEYSIFGY